MKTPRQLKRQVNSTPKKKQAQTTPKKSIKNGLLKETCTEQISDIQSGNLTQPVPDLWLEAKMKAEEDARIFGGRQIHPFFSSTKMTKNIRETNDVERNWCSVVQKDKCTTLSPIHVYEMVQDDVDSLDWGNWILSERSLVSSNCDLKTVCSSVSKGSVNSLKFDDSLILYPSRTPLLQNEAIPNEVIPLDQSTVQEEHERGISDEPVAPCEDLEVDRQGHDHVCHTRNLDAAGECRCLSERMKTYYNACGSHPLNSLWTNKYLPEKAIEVCGNGESVNFLSKWLRLWHERGFRSSKDLSVGKSFVVHDDDYNCYQSDECDSENTDEDNSLKNVLLVTGPIGSGKSAAIYACAKEQGFHVIEVSASDWRTRTLVMQRFEGGVESHSVHRTLKAPPGTESKLIPKSLSVIPSTIEVQGSDNEVFELIPVPDEEEDSQNAAETPVKFVSKVHATATDQTASKPLILFEDVDAILSEDHGLIATIQKLAETAKRPIILTSNNHNPVLPNNLDRLELCFTKPSLKELLCHAHMVCAKEKAKVQPCLVERFIGCFQGDIRKTLMHLQFWCQGREYMKDSKAPSCCLEAGMCFVPIPEQILNAEVEKLEEIFSLCPESALYTLDNLAQKSVDVSCVPESSFVPETEVDDGTSLFNRTVSSRRDADIVDEVSMFNDSMRNVQAVETNNHNQYVSGLHDNRDMVENINAYTESADEEEMGDSNHEHVGAIPSGYPVMDECSRMDFSMGAKSKEKPSSWVLRDSVQETWRRIRSSLTDLRPYVTPEEKNGSHVLKLAFGLCNLMSEADMLLSDCHPIICDSLEPSMVLREKTNSFSWYDDQLWMTSTIAQHGFCFYSKDIAAVGSSNGYENKMDLASEMLASSSNTMALGKLVGQDMRIENFDMGPEKNVISAECELDSCISSVVQSIVPSRLYLATKGDASFYEYLSSLGQISRSEASRLSESIDNTIQKRVRVARNYLSTGALMLSPDDISFLGQYHSFGKASSQSMDRCWR